MCEAIWNRLQPVYMKNPTEEMWTLTSEEFYNLWQFPNCIGSIAGKHVTVVCPRNSGSNYFCYLKNFSIVLMAIVGPQYNFLCIDVGGYGKNSDGGIFENSVMGRQFCNGTMNIPHNKPLPGYNVHTSHVLVGDEAFALKTYLMKPFNQREALRDMRKERYNKRLCRARRVVENAFGIMAQKWRIFLRPIPLHVSKSVKVVKACCVLHNYLRSKTCTRQYLTQLYHTESQDNHFNRNVAHNANAETGHNVREQFVNYFNTD